MFVNCVSHLLVLPRHAQPAVQLIAGQTIQLLYFCTKNKVVVVKRTGGGRYTEFEGRRGGGGERARGESSKRVGSVEVQVLNNLQSKKG